MKPKFFLLALFSALLFAGCNRALIVQTPLEPDENTAKGEIVFVDGTSAGNVKKVVIETGQRIAVLAITNESVKQKMRTGIVRVRDDGKINLRTDGTAAEAPLLISGATIPVTSKTGFAARQLTSSRMLTGLFAGVVIIAVVLLLFRRLARGWLLLLTLVLSAASAWILMPWMASIVAKGYALLTQPGSTSGNAGAQHAISRFIENPPSPQIVAYAVVFVGAFITFSILLRGALNRLETRS